MDLASLHALQIFSEERHPSRMGIGSAKEGFSLFALANKCATQMVGGREAQRRLRPATGATGACINHIHI